MTEKVKLQAYINKSVDVNLRKFIAERYQTFEKGLLSAEVEAAINHWVAMNTNTQKYPIDSLPPNPLPRVSKHYRAFKEYLLSTDYLELHPGATIPKRHVVKAIQNTRGVSDRTVKKWIRIFTENKLIRELSPTSIELIA